MANKRLIKNIVDIQNVLADFKVKINKEIEIYFDRAIRDSSRRDVFIADALKYVKKATLSGGKRLRAAFMYYGYLAAGGKERQKILKTAVSIELIHMFLLIHDDIMDKDDRRHGIDTVNSRYQKLGKRLFPKKDYSHFGCSMAIIIGDMIGAMGNQVIFNSNFDARLVFEALTKLQEIVSMTVIGQSKDFYMEFSGKASEKEILKMYEYKTAKYSIEGPLHLGAVLGGADGKILEGLTAYAIPIGIAFQIQDDILGIFGSEKKIGKPLGSDIREGKQTILVAKALAMANQEQLKQIKKILGKENITSNEVADFQNIIKETGALDYAQEMAWSLIKKGKREAEKAGRHKEAKDFLVGIADYMVNREV